MRLPALVPALCSLLIVVHPQAQTPGSVTLDVVLSGPGAPSLAPGDLVVRLDGRVYPVTAIRRAAPPIATPRLLPAPYGRNDLPRGRTLAVLVDTPRLSATHGPVVSTGLTHLVGALTPLDRLALIPLSSNARPLDFTTLHTRALTAVAALPLGPPPASTTAREREAAAQALLDATARLATMLGGEEGVKTILVVTEPFTPNGRLREAMQDLGALVARHRIALYVATPGGSKPGDGAHALAAATGGAVVGPTWGDLIALETGRAEVTVTADARLSPGMLTRTMVATVRRDVTLRWVPQTVVRANAAPALEALSDMLRQGRTFADLPLRLAAYPVQHQDRTLVRLLIVGEPMDGSGLQWGEFALVTPDGRLASQWAEDRASLARRPVVSGVVVPEGAYRLRWAASELSGRRGAVDVDVDARLTPAGSYQLSALMVGRLEADTFIPVLQPDADVPEVEWYAEVYGGAASSARLAARLEVRAGPTSPVLATEAGRVLLSPDPQRRAITGRVSVGALAAGDYELRAILSVDGVDAGVITRTLQMRR